ncbi:MAG: GspE/PulE family protein [Candidatus Omnitrophota bacterium]
MAAGKNNSIENILFEKGKIDKQQLEDIRAMRERTGESSEAVIRKKKLATDDEIMQLMSESMGVPFIELDTYIIDPVAVNLLDEKVVRRLKVIPLYAIRDTLTVAMANPQDILALDEIKMLTKYKNVQAVMASEKDVMSSIEQAYVHGKSLEDIVKPLETKGMIYAESSYMTSQSLALLAGQPPVVKFVNQMIYDAVKNRASDIHVEPMQDIMRIRFRVDGVLHTAVNISRNIHLPLAPRIKILSGLDIAERRKPQDGRFTVNVAGREIDLRVATFPTAYGESVSIRLLDKSTSLIAVEDLGLTKTMLKKFKRLIKSAHGCILVTGPTGSGKTTTLYAILNDLASPEKNILTIEDPIEYMVGNVTQAQVNPKIGLDFASALRSFLRHDPDVIMVGEIRDYETTEMAFRAALTGHLVLSTVHTNDAPGTIMRLIDMGLDKNMLTSCLVCIIAQRLVRLICESCKTECVPDKALLEDAGIDAPPGAKFYKGKGCEECNGVGYRGRIGIFELLEFSDELRLMVQKNAPLEEVRQTAIKAGMTTLKQDGIDKVLRGLITVEELLRVTQE